MVVLRVVLGKSRCEEESRWGSGVDEGTGWQAAAALAKAIFLADLDCTGTGISIDVEAVEVE
jgi:hypothetical protein